MLDRDLDRVREGVAVFNTLQQRKRPQRPFSLGEEENPPVEKRPDPAPAALRAPEPGHKFDQVV